MRGRPKGQSIFLDGCSLNTEEILRWKKKFLEVADMTEYYFALEMGFTWEDYTRMKNNNKIYREKLLPAWKEELKVKMEADVVSKIIEDARDGNMSSAKWVAEKIIGVEKKKKPGRPPKKKEEESNWLDQYDEDLKRIDALIN